VPIPGSRTPSHITENTDAARMDMHPDILTRLDTVLNGISVTGATML
jgi:aryl-alcohol dehydrogenase-like predicted oxidoreductase